MAEKWIIEHQDESGYWGGIFPAMVNSVLALHLLGYSLDHLTVKRGIAAIDKFSSNADGTYRVQSTVSPVWDTAITMLALLDSGADPADPRLIKAGEWLLSKQITRKGDWAVKNPHLEPGGWPFEHENDFFPDNDDTALVLLALRRLKWNGSTKINGEARKKEEAMEMGVNWLFGMQCKDGGWGAFDKDNNRELLNEIPFADLKSLLDPSSPDVTGHVLEVLGHCDYTTDDAAVKRAIRYLHKTQEENGSWFGRWGVNYIYGTSAVLIGLAEIGESMSAPYVRRGAGWLLSCQHRDGGWGESCESYEQQEFVPEESTPSQTAWALLGLCAAGLADHPAVREGFTWLARQQNPDGSWDEMHWTGTGFPRHFYLRYDMYRLYFPVLALGRYLLDRGITPKITQFKSEDYLSASQKIHKKVVRKVSALINDSYRALSQK